MRRRKSKKLLPLLITSVMVLALFPGMAFADEATESTETTEVVTQIGGGCSSNGQNR